MNHIVAPLVAVTTTTTSGSTSSSGSYFFLVVLVLLAAAYFLFMRPNQRRRVQAARQARSFETGDEVVAAGMVGRVVSIADGEVEVEVADGVVLTFVNQAVQSRQAFVASQNRAASRFGAGPPPRTAGRPTGQQGTSAQASLDAGSSGDADDEDDDDAATAEGFEDNWPSGTGSEDEGDRA